MQHHHAASHARQHNAFTLSTALSMACVLRYPASLHYYPTVHSSLAASMRCVFRCAFQGRTFTFPRDMRRCEALMGTGEHIAHHAPMHCSRARAISPLHVASMRALRLCALPAKPSCVFAVLHMVLCVSCAGVGCGASGCAKRGVGSLGCRQRGLGWAG